MLLLLLLHASGSAPLHTSISVATRLLLGGVELLLVLLVLVGMLLAAILGSLAGRAWLSAGLLSA